MPIPHFKALDLASLVGLVVINLGACGFADQDTGLGIYTTPEDAACHDCTGR